MQSIAQSTNWIFNSQLFSSDRQRLRFIRRFQATSFLFLFYRSLGSLINTSWNLLALRRCTYQSLWRPASGLSPPCATQLPPRRFRWPWCSCRILFIIPNAFFFGFHFCWSVPMLWYSLFGKITLELEMGLDFQVAPRACHAPKQFWRQTKCCSAKFSSIVGRWGFVIAVPGR